MAISYTNHIGRSSRDKHSGKNTAISSIHDLASTEKHNNHDYTQADVSRMQSDINLDQKDLNRQYVMVDGELIEIEGHLDLEANVRKIYDEQFADAINEYNLQQLAAGHPERQIHSYIDKISEDKQQEVAVEGLIQFGSFEDWEKKTTAERTKAVPLLLQCLKDTVEELRGENKELILAGASIHLNEGSPHLHYVGVPVQHTPDAKKGLKKRVKKTAVFTKETLGTGLQDNVRAKIAPHVKDVFGWDFEDKKTGRNEDRDKRTQVNEKLKEQIQENEKIINAQKDEIDKGTQLKGEVAASVAGLLEEHKNLREEISDLYEDKNLIQSYEDYDYEVTEIDRKLDGWAEELDDILDVAQKTHTPAPLVERLLNSVLKIMEDAAAALRRRIDRIHIFEQIHNVLFPNSKRLHKNLDDVIAGARTGQAPELEHREQPSGLDDR